MAGCGVWLRHGLWGLGRFFNSHATGLLQHRSQGLAFQDHWHPTIARVTDPALCFKSEFLVAGISGSHGNEGSQSYPSHSSKGQGISRGPLKLVGFL